MKFKMESNYTELQKVVYKKVGGRTEWYTKIGIEDLVSFV